jgi:tRNA threonylcarbamoyladenosine biosynthesis protein TsaE
MVRTASVAETLAFGRRIGAALEVGWVIGLVGELGVGKTHLVKGIAAGNWTGQGPVPEVTSPTFVLVNEYAGRVPLFHLDAYRLRADQEMTDLGIDEMATQGAVIVEWADRVPAAMPPERITIAGRSTGETEREWEIGASGLRSIQWLGRL